MSTPSDSGPARLRRAGKGILKWLLGSLPDAEPVGPPAVDPNPVSIPPWSFVPMEPRAEVQPLLRTDWEEEDDVPSGPPFIYHAIRDRVLDVCCLLRSVKGAMTDLAGSYRAELPPSRLQLCPWGFPKGTPPRALYWVRLARKQEEVCDDRLQVRALRRPRWFKRLKIRTRTDLRDAVHWNGLDGVRNAVLRYHELASCLNRAHRTLSRRPAHLVRLFLRYRGGIRDVHGCPDVPLEDCGYELVNGVGAQLVRGAWRMQWAIEKELARLNHLSIASGGPEFRLEAWSPGKTGKVEGFVWAKGGTRMDGLLAGGRASSDPGREDSSASERAELLKLLDSRIEIVHLVLSRLREIHAEANREMIDFRSSAPPAPAGPPGRGIDEWA